MKGRGEPFDWEGPTETPVPLEAESFEVQPAVISEPTVDAPSVRLENVALSGEAPGPASVREINEVGTSPARSISRRSLLLLLIVCCSFSFLHGWSVGTAAGGSSSHCVSSGCQ